LSSHIFKSFTLSPKTNLLNGFACIQNVSGFSFSHDLLDSVYESFKTLNHALCFSI